MQSTAIHEYLNKQQAVGAIVVLFTSDQTVLGEWTYGSQGRNREIDLNTRFGIASITKSFTALTALKLNALGRVDLQRPLSFYYPHVHLDKTLQIHHLLNHSAGFLPQHRTTLTDVLNQLNQAMDSPESMNDDEVESYAMHRIFSQLQANASAFTKPGERFSYSNDGYGLLTDLIRNHSADLDYTACAEAMILSPLGMSRSTFDYRNLMSDTNTSLLFEKTSKGIISHQDFMSNAFALPGVGALKSTALDMIHYGSYLLGAGLSYCQAMTEDTIECSQYQRMGYGVMTESLQDVILVSHGGSLPGVSSALSLCPQAQIGVIVLCNTSGVASSALARMIMMDRLNLDEHKEAEHRESSTILQALQGSYSSLEGDSVVIVGQQVLQGEHAFHFDLIDENQMILENRNVYKYYQDHLGINAIRVGLRVLTRE